MALEVGYVAVNDESIIAGSGMAMALFDARKGLIDEQLDAADAAAAGRSRNPDPAKVKEFLSADLMRHGPLVAGYYSAKAWPEDLLSAPATPMSRVGAYRGLARQCVADATGMITYLLANSAVIPDDLEVAGVPVTGTGRVS
jgi:hypothetical protein